MSVGIHGGYAGEGAGGGSGEVPTRFFDDSYTILLTFPHINLPCSAFLSDLYLMIFYVFRPPLESHDVLAEVPAGFVDDSYSLLPTVPYLNLPFSTCFSDLSLENL